MNVALDLSPSARLRSLGPVADWLADEQVRLVRQPSDAEWIYTKATRVSGMGFNPLRGEIYICANALVARWLDGSTTDLRELNASDQFINELLFCTHDYLHAWASLQIHELVPELGFATAALSPAKLEAQAFALLLSEAVAVVGLDYWWLSTFDRPATLGIGSCVQNLAVSYRESDREEFCRAAPDFETQAPAFFRSLAEFYCHGRFPGFDARDLGRSPRLLRWLRHELSYGEVQRRYVRQWLHHLAGLPSPTRAACQAPVECDAQWQTRLLDELGARLWAKIKGGDPCPAQRPLDPDTTWTAPERGPIDARFTNLASFEDADAVIERRGLAPDSLAHWAEQRLHLHLHTPEDPDFLALVPSLMRSVKDDGGALLRWALRERPRVPRTANSTSPSAPVRDLFFLK